VKQAVDATSPDPNPPSRMSDLLKLADGMLILYWLRLPRISQQ